MSSFGALLVTLVTAGLPVPAEDVDPRDAYDVLSYAIVLDVDPEEQTIDGSVTVRAKVVAVELDAVVLDLVDELDVRGVRGPDGPLPFERRADNLVVAPGRTFAAGDELELTVAYGGSPRAQNSFSGFHWAETEDGRPWINTSCQGPGAHSWWPCKSSFYNPEDKPESVSMTVTVPGDLYAVSNGRLLGIDDAEGGRRTFRWQHDYPLETYTVTLNVAPYVVVESELELPGIDQPVPWIYYVREESAEKAALQFQQVPELIEIYSEAFGPWPFPDSKLALVETNFWGMEHSTAVAYGSSFPAWCEANDVEDPYGSRNRWFDYILVHEVAHEWWGNAVSTTSWGDFWIHEGFGTYAEGVYVEKTQGREAADRYFREQGFRMPAGARLWRGDGVDSGEAYSGVVYSKGATVLHTLRHYVNDDDAWWRSLREFNLQYRYGNAGTEQFRAVLEEVTGEDQERFFTQWVYGEGQPRIRGTVRAGEDRIAVEVTNEGTGETGFHVPLDLAWTEAGVERTRRLTVPPGGLETELGCELPPANLRVVNLGRVLGRHDVDVE